MEAAVMAFHVPEKYRIRKLGGDNGNGAFFIPLRPGQHPMRVIASDGLGWEHVSVSLPDRCPTWDEMCRIKAMFWDDDDCVVQFHPPRSEYVNNHPYCLHMWRQVGADFPMPDSILVGFKEFA